MIKKNTILVVGDLMIDHYLFGDAHRISPEAPIPVLKLDREEDRLGGAGNVANNLAALNADVQMASVLGSDQNAQVILKLLDEKNISSDKVIFESTRVTTKKSRLIAKNQQMIRFDSETTHPITSESEQKLLQRIESDITQYAAIILSDYAKGVLTTSLTRKIIALADQHNVKVIVDPKGKDYSKYKGAYILTPNKKEAVEVTGYKINDQNALAQAASSMKSDYDLNYALITLSADGVALFDKELQLFPTVAKKIFDVTGAGDTFIASLTYALTQGQTIVKAIDFANHAAGVVVAKVGSATATLEEIKAHKKHANGKTTSSKIVSFEEIKTIVTTYKQENKTIVFTNGCFDLLHLGHVDYLETAKQQADILILGLNTDASVSRLKGPSRPINNETDRARILAALAFVDHVVLFGADTPYELISIVQPDVLVKGADYEGKEVVGSDIAKQVKLIKFVEGKSTTGMIDKIQLA